MADNNAIIPLEKHLQTAAIAALLGLNAWTANLTHNTSVSLAALTAKIEAFDGDVARMEARMDRLERRLEQLDRRSVRENP